MRIGLIGAGRIGAMHARLLAGLEGVDELLIADATRSERPPWRPQVGARAFPSVEALMDTADAIVIAAATDAHADLVRAAIARRIPTYCEKPLAGTLDETIAVAQLIEASGVPFQLGFQRRFDAGYREARRMVESGELGTVYVVRLAGHDPAPPHESYIPASGGLFRDFSVHDFDVIRWLLGSEVAEVYATAASGASLSSPSTATWTPAWPRCAWRTARWPCSPAPATIHSATTSGRSCSDRGTASAWVSARTRRCGRWSPACHRPPVPPGRTSSPASRVPTAPS